MKQMVTSKARVLTGGFATRRSPGVVHAHRRCSGTIALRLIAATALLVAAVAARPAAAANISFVKTIGTTTSTTAATTTAVTVPAAGVARGASIIVTVGLPSNALGSPPGDVSAVDTAGNTYTADADVTNAANARIVVLSSHKVLPLVSTNTITVTHPSTNRRNVVAVEYAGLAASPNVDQTATNTGSENNATPATVGPTAATTVAKELLIGAFGVSGPSGDNFTAGGGYASAGRISASNTVPTVTNIQEYQVVSTTAAYSAGFTTTTTTARQYAGAIVTYKEDTTCGDGTVDAGEDCDNGADNGLSTSCCNANCRFVASGTTCRTAAGLCDVIETCTGSSATCPADVISVLNTVCRPVAAECDIQEVCDGISTQCPAVDVMKPVDTPCTDDGTSCTVDTCNGLVAACQHPADTGSPCVKFIQTIGTSTSTTAAATTAVTVPAAGVASGGSIIVTVGLPSGLAGAVSAVDTAGNTYTSDADVTNAANARIVVLSSHKVLALASTNTITVTHPSTNRRNVVAVEYSGLAVSPNVDKTATNTGSESNLTPATVGPTVATTQADELLIGAFGVSGPSSDNFTAGASYASAGRVSASNTVPTVTNVQEYRVVNTMAAYSAGFTTTTTTARQYAGAIVTYKADTNCGNGTVEAGEDCDLGLAGNGGTSTCCTRNCKFRTASAVCRAGVDLCDAAETCATHTANGSCSADVKYDTSHVCRAAAGDCDLAETCDGVTNVCPADVLKAADVPCPDDGSSCTVDKCNGTSTACQHPANTGYPCVKFIQTIGTTTSTTAATTTAVTVPAAGVASGAGIIVTVGLPSNALGSPPGDVSVGDTAGNVYAVDSDVTNPANSRIVVLSSQKAKPLVQGNTITVTHPSTNRRNVVAVEYSGLAASPNVDQTATNTASESNLAPATVGPTVATTQADELLIGAFGVSGPSSDNFTAGASYASAGRVSASNTVPTVTNVQEYRVVNTMAAYSAGFTTTTTTARQYAGAIVTYKADVGCGNGVVDPNEQCDLGIDTNGAANNCCTRNCMFRVGSGVCRAAANLCDAPETCATSTDGTCPVDVLWVVGHVCRATAGECDIEEQCDGATNVCPADVLKPAVTPCTDDGNPCSLDECNGTIGTCQHPAGHAGAVCRAAGASCDAVELCTGSSTTCPANGNLPVGTVCRAATDLCDVDEKCLGTSPSCGPDRVAVTATLCRTATDLCDVDDTCDGLTKVCVDNVAAVATDCRASSGECDLVDQCDGSSKECFDPVKAAGTSCGAAPADVCDMADECDGTTKDCTDAVKPTSEVCRSAVDFCDTDDHCDGSGKACPEDLKQPSSLLCRAVAGPCDVAELCSGSDDACPSDTLRPAGYLCRPVANDCDVPDYCNGAEAACVDDAYQPEGTVCEGTNEDACLNACINGVCTDGAPVTEQVCCGNGIVDVGETCDDGNQNSGDTCPSRPGENCDFASAGTFVRGNARNPATDRWGCALEFGVSNLLYVFDRFGLPGRTLRCTDGDVCDLDGTADGLCRFGVAVCVNNDDPSLPACMPSGVSSVAIKPPKQSLPPDHLALLTANVGKIQRALDNLRDPAHPEEWYTQLLPITPDQRNLCSGTVLIDVPAGTTASDVKRKMFRLRAVSTDTDGKARLSAVYFMCQTAQ